MWRWRALYGAAPSSYDWSRTHARRRGGDALARVNEGDWPPPATVVDLYGTWAAALADAFPETEAIGVEALADPSIPVERDAKPVRSMRRRGRP